jgi:drug/metabolite transporter (DMT)-like permease
MTSCLSRGNLQVVVLSIIYGALSLLMIFVNKLILREGSASDTITPDTLLIIQCIISFIVIFVVSFAVRYSLRIAIQDFAVCAVVNLTFVGAMLANSYTLRYLSIHMVTLLKCCSVVVTALGDQFWYANHLTWPYWVGLFLIVLGSMVGLLTDLEFSWIGCFWMALSILFSSAYILLSKLLISHRNLPFFTVVFWNNFLGTLVLAIYILANPKLPHKRLFELLIGVFQNRSISSFLSPWFILFSGAIGLLLNISTFSLLGQASATSYVVVGAGKKILQALIAYIFFDSPATWLNILSVTTGLGGATMYSYLKWRDQRPGTGGEVMKLLADGGTHEPPDHSEVGRAYAGA